MKRVLSAQKFYKDPKRATSFGNYEQSPPRVFRYLTSPKTNWEVWMDQSLSHESFKCHLPAETVISRVICTLFRGGMEKRKPAGLLVLPCPLRMPLGALPRREPGRTSVRQDAEDSARRRPCPSLSLGGVGEPAFLRQRNERERQRVRCVNEGYARLRQHLPRELAGQRLSKVETLRAAIGYIKHLQELLERHRPDCNSDGESKASSGASPCSEPEERG